MPGGGEDQENQIMRGTRLFGVWIGFLLFGQAALATVSIQYTVLPVGGNVYRYVYSITNSGGSPAVRLFDILFDTSLYQESSLQIVTAAPLNSQWTQQILHSVPPAIPSAYDSFTIGGGIPAGTTVTGFSVQFVWLGTGGPAAQPFQIFDPTTFDLLQTGTTTYGVFSVPASSTLSLALLALALAGATACQARMRTAEAIRSRLPESW
jgi:hypothetical protein